MNIKTLSIKQTPFSTLTRQKAEQIQRACIKFCKLFDTPEQKADPDAIYTLPSNQNAVEEARINELSEGHIQFRFLKEDTLFFRFQDYGKTFFLTGARAYNNICKQLLLAQNEIEQLKSHQEEFIAGIPDCQFLSSKEELLLIDESQFCHICEVFFDKFFSSTQPLFYLPTLKAFNQSIKGIFGGEAFYPEAYIDDSSRLLLQIHTVYEDDKNMCNLTRKRLAVQKKERVVSHILECWRLFCKIEKRWNNIINLNKSTMSQTSVTKIVEHTTASQSCNENGKNNYEVAKKIAIYLVQVNSNGSELADFAKFSGVSTALFVVNATHGAVEARVIQDAIVLKESATGYESAFMTKFISDSHLEERLVDDITLFINKAMDEIKHEPSKDDAHETNNTNNVDDATLENDTRVVTAFNEKFAETENEIFNYLAEASDKKTRKQRIYSWLRKCLWGVGYKGNAHKVKILSLLTPENLERYNTLVELAA
jgi:hypothetical protein